MTKILLLILVGWLGFCGSMTSHADDAVSKASNSINETTAAGHKNATQTVQRFMELIASSENEKAKALMFDGTVDRKKPDSSEATGSLHEVPPTFDWVTVLSDRKFRLVKVLSEHSDGDKAEVMTEMNIENMKSFIQKTVFELRKVGDQWRISDVNFVDKAAGNDSPKS